MTILEFASHYNLHDSLIQAIEYKKDSQRLIFRLEFCYWAQDGYNETQQPVGEVNLVFDGVADYQGLTGEIDYFSILDFTATDNQVRIYVLDDYNDKSYQLKFCAKQVSLKDVSIIINNEQRAMLEKYGISIDSDINSLLLDLDAKITEIGFNADYSLNKVGLQLQRLYDELYDQN